MKKTTHLELNKPELTDYVNIENLNENADIIDEAIHEYKEKLTTHLADNVKHITAQERNVWNAKQTALPVENRRKITFGTSEPTGGSDGDIYFQHE